MGKSLKQVLVRDYNWRMGNLNRIKGSLGAIDDDLKFTIQDLIIQQKDRECQRHEARLAAIEGPNKPVNDWIWDKAVLEVKRSERDD